MDEEIKEKLVNILLDEAEHVSKMKTDTKQSIKCKCKKMDTIMNMLKIIEHYDRLEKPLRKFFCEQAQKTKEEQYR